VGCPAFVVVEPRIQQIREKKRFQNGKHDKKFDQYNSPKGATRRHVFKPVAVEGEQPVQKIESLHGKKYVAPKIQFFFMHQKNIFSDKIFFETPAGVSVQAIARFGTTLY
jgi:hypothetical protein